MNMSNTYITLPTLLIALRRIVNCFINIDAFLIPEVQVNPLLNESLFSSLPQVINLYSTSHATVWVMALDTGQRNN